MIQRTLRTLALAAVIAVPALAFASPPPQGSDTAATPAASTPARNRSARPAHHATTRTSANAHATKRAGNARTRPNQTAQNANRTARSHSVARAHRAPATNPPRDANAPAAPTQK